VKGVLLWWNKKGLPSAGAVSNTNCTRLDWGTLALNFVGGRRTTLTPWDAAVCTVSSHAVKKLSSESRWVEYLANTGWSKSLCAPDDYSTKTRKNVLNNFNQLPW
jgi:hypothetical protein